MKAAFVYRAYAAIVWTGVLRPFLWAASSKLKELASEAFPLPVVRAQVNTRSFFASLTVEMETMMCLCDASRAAWGLSLDLATLPRETVRAIGNSRPSSCGDAVAEHGKAYVWKDLPRSKEEAGADWDSPEVARALLAERLSASPTAPLPAAWRTLVVAAVSARSYNFGMGPADSFYEPVMREWAAAEHSMHVLLAKAGWRTVFPTRTHMDAFFGLLPFIADQVSLLVDQLEREDEAE